MSWFTADRERALKEAEREAVEMKAKAENVIKIEKQRDAVVRRDEELFGVVKEQSSAILQLSGQVRGGAMGTDIHLHVEIKVEGVWQHWNAPDVDRDYQLFAKMAGVRNYEDKIVPISEPKGLPDDITTMTRIDYQHTSSHTPSWLNRREIKELEEWWEGLRAERRRRSEDFYGKSFESGVMGGYLFGNAYTGDLKGSVEDVRAVFWFDC